MLIYPIHQQCSSIAHPHGRKFGALIQEEATFHVPPPIHPNHRHQTQRQRGPHSLHMRPPAHPPRARPVLTALLSPNRPALQPEWLRFVFPFTPARTRGPARTRLEPGSCRRRAAHSAELLNCIRDLYFPVGAEPGTNFSNEIRVCDPKCDDDS